MKESLDVSGHGSGMMIDGGGYSMRLSFPVSARLTDDSPILLVPADERDVEPLRRLYRIIVDEGTYYPHDRFPDQDDFLDYWFRGKSTVAAHVPDRARLAWRLCGFVTNSREYCRLVFSEMWPRTVSGKNLALKYWVSSPARCGRTMDRIRMRSLCFDP